MKRNTIFTLGLSLVLLASCGMDSFGKVVDGEEDFIEVASSTASGLVVARTYRSCKTTDKAPEIGEKFDPHVAELYSGLDFYLAAPVGGVSVDVTGFTKDATQFLITSETDKKGISSSNPHFLDAYQDAAVSLIEDDYNLVANVYEGMKPYAGKTSGEVGGKSYSSIYIATSLAGNTAGYTLKTVRNDGDVTYKLSEYITMDKVGDNWAFTFYSRRLDYITEENTFQYVTEYSFTCLTSLDDKPLKKKNNVSDFSFAIEGLTTDAINPVSGTILTGK